MATYWLQFSHAGESLGAAIVEADDLATDVAVADRAISIGCYPGRSDITIRRIRDTDVPLHMRDRLLSKDEAAAFIEGRAT